MFLLDTNVVLELRKIGSGQADQHVTDWARETDASTLYLSCISLQELETDILRVERRDRWHGAMLREWFEHRVLSTFAERMLPIDIAVARRCAELHVPEPRPIREALISATALVHGLTVVTRNTADFAPTKVALLNPWLARS
ncbi:type II toxin-antitoxin system VapC family toxin [Rhabdochromatium marinum]|uniref:type II toxin-antitoxin system VapC family toxin n=1 Tax=Rhabdochromatium marinum TaxID=48729 RepID=UPI0019042C6C|nr:type II toxin-antitoxin system VapC family toxin [Rhabdochromatium marinum]MBK1649272.1 VapC toxin family PIN domain ribonuclease [Rhabdochromatium marinum]